MAKKKSEPAAAKPKAAPKPKAPKAAAKPAKKSAPAPADAASPDSKKAATQASALSTELIGLAAGNVWATLSSDGPHTLAALKKAVDVSPELLCAAVGWLAREDKVAFETSGRTVTVSLR